MLCDLCGSITCIHWTSAWFLLQKTSDLRHCVMLKYTTTEESTPSWSYNPWVINSLLMFCFSKLKIACCSGLWKCDLSCLEASRPFCLACIVVHTNLVKICILKFTVKWFDLKMTPVSCILFRVSTWLIVFLFLRKLYTLTSARRLCAVESCPFCKKITPACCCTSVCDRRCMPCLNTGSAEKC